MERRNLTENKDKQGKAELKKRILREVTEEKIITEKAGAFPKIFFSPQNL